MERLIESKTFDEIRAGDTASIERNFAANDLRAWSILLGNASAGASDGSKHGAAGLATALLSSLAELQLPGPGSIICSISLDMKRPIKPGAIKAILTVKAKRPEHKTVMIDGQCTDATGSVIAKAVLEVEPAKSKLQQRWHEHLLDELVEQCRGQKPIVTGVVHPCSANALEGAVEASDSGLIIPVLFGPEHEIKSIAEQAKVDISHFKIVSTSDPAESAERAALAAGAGELKALMKGSLHTSVFLHAILEKEAKLRTERLLSHCALIAVPEYA
ncbi:MAG: hypothetical protein WBX25_34330, partial [Rhodomicrobium sp.]